MFPLAWVTCVTTLCRPTGCCSFTDRTLSRMAPVRRGLGILGGTFDPPHIGHIAAAVEVRSALHLDRVLLMVANDPWQKTGTRLLSEASARLAMVSAAVEGLDGLEASGLEIDRGGVTYTIDTLQVLRSSAPDQQLFLIVGSDAATTLHTWHRYEELQDLATLVIVDRDGHSDAEPPPGWSAVRVAIPRLDISSSELRDRVRSGQPLEPFVEASVIEEIRSRGLYGSDDS